VWALKHHFLFHFNLFKRSLLQLSEFASMWGNGEEVIIMRDPAFSLVKMVDDDVVLYQSLVSVTNRQIIVEPISGSGADKASLDLMGIVCCCQKDVKEMKVLEVRSSDGASILVLGKDSVRHLALAEIISKLCEGISAGEPESERIVRNIRRSVLQSPEWYLLQTNSDRRTFISCDETTDSLPVVLELFSHFLGDPQLFFGLLVNVSELDARLFFGILVIIVTIFSILFRLFSLGICFFGFVFVIVMSYGLGSVFWDIQPPRSLMCPYHKLSDVDQLRQTVVERFFWQSPQKTLELVLFVLSSAFLFRVVDPAVILAFSMIGLGIVESWNPFGYGNPAEIMMTLFNLHK
jgi:hypothetical protein